MKSIVALIALWLCMAGPALAVFKTTGELCFDQADVQVSKTSYEQALAHDKAGRTKEAYDAAVRANTSCIGGDRAELKPLMAILKKTSLKLGEEAEGKGSFAEAYKYYEYYDGIAADRVQMKLATAKPDDFKTVQTGVVYFRNMQEILNNKDIPESMKHYKDLDEARLAAMEGYTSRGTLDAMDPNRDARIKAISGYLNKLQAIATKNGEKFLSDEDKIFKARKTSVTAKDSTINELNKARDWFGLFGQEKRANDQAVKRGDTLLADDARKSLELAISYYEFAGNENKVRKVQDKARSLGDAHLKKGEKKMAAEYYNIAGLGDKASKLEEAHEAEKEQAESKRQEKFKKEQESLEKELEF